MYNKKYKLESVKELNNTEFRYENIIGNTCYLAYLNPGEPGWFLCEFKNELDPVHRFKTSEVKDVEYQEDRVVVTTANSMYVFVKKTNLASTISR